MQNALLLSRLCGKYQTASEIEDPKIERAREALMQGFLTHLPNTESARVIIVITIFPCLNVMLFFILMLFVLVLDNQKFRTSHFQEPATPFCFCETT